MRPPNLPDTPASLEVRPSSIAPNPVVLLDTHPLQKPSRLPLDPWVFQALMESLASWETPGSKDLWAYKVSRVPGKGNLVGS